MASYPSGVVNNFTTHVNLTEIVDASHPNLIQAEVVAIESTLGVNPHIGTVASSAGSFNNTGATFASVAARLANLETGVVADSHTHYIHKSGGDTIAPAAGVVGLTMQPTAAPTGNLWQVNNHLGAQQLAIDSNYRLLVGGTSPVISQANAATSTTTQVAGDAGTVGTAVTFAREDHKHAMPAADPVAGTAGFRTLGAGAQQAAAGNHLHDSNYAALSHTHTQAQSHNSPDTDSATTALHHTLGAGANQAAAGNHTHGSYLSQAYTTVASSGTAQTQRSTLNLVTGTGILVADDAVNSRTNISLDVGTAGTQVAAGNHLHTGTYQPAGSYAAATHSHAESDVTSLVTDLNGKASTSHTHSGVYQPAGSYTANAGNGGRVISGTIQITLSGGVGTGTISFSGFSGTPIVVANCLGGSGSGYVSINNSTSTSADLIVQNSSGTSRFVNYFVIGN